MAMVMLGAAGVVFVLLALVAVAASAPTSAFALAGLGVFAA